MTQVTAQITPDSTLGVESSVVTPQDELNDQIEGGAARGGNLFHSFTEFNVGEGRGVDFVNPDSIDNIITRVTGGNVSNILGRLGVLGEANLFLINPNGIIFGEGARLDIGGSFYGSTADSILFPDGIEFSATNPQRPILTINVPIGLGFGNNPGTIINNSVAEGVGLTVAPGENLALIGGNITLEGGIISASEGKIELGSVAGNSVVNLEPVNFSFELGYDEATNFGNIALTQGSKIETSEADIKLPRKLISLNNSSQITSVVEGSQTGGDININARQLMINDQANLLTSTFGGGDAGNINANISESIEIVATGFEQSQEIFITRSLDRENPLDINTVLNAGTGIFTATDGQGIAGTIAIDTSLLKLQEGGVIAGLTFAEGDLGSLIINATESIEIISSQIFNISLLGSTGKGNLLEINTLYLTVSDGGIITSATLGEGNGGDIFINASEQIDILRDLPNSFINTGIFSNSGLGNGAAGNITVNTPTLNLQEGGQIASVSGIVTRFYNIYDGGTGGNITINVPKYLEISGYSSDNIFFNSAVVTNTLTENNAGDLEINTGKITISNDGFISVGTSGQGNAGEIKITTINFSLTNGGLIEANNSGLGNAGNIFIKADSLTLDNGSISAPNNPSMPITTNEALTSGGNINLTIKDNLILDNESVISVQAGENASGGNIDINAKFIIAFPNQNSDITANAFNGSGGQININAVGIFGIEAREELTPQSDITAFSQINPSLNGQININTLEIDPSRETFILPNQPLNTQISQICTPGTAEAKSEFTFTGRGGIAPNTLEALQINPIAPDWVELPEASNKSSEINSSSFSVPNPTPQIVEATGWIRDENGEVILVADVNNVTGYDPWQKPRQCANN